MLLMKDISFTLIIASFTNEINELEYTLSSLQKFDNIPQIIICILSSEREKLKFINSNIRKNPNITFLTEKKSISCCLNQALKKIKNDYFTIINEGSYLEIENILMGNQIIKKYDTDIFYGLSFCFCNNNFPIGVHFFKDEFLYLKYYEIDYFLDCNPFIMMKSNILNSFDGFFFNTLDLNLLELKLFIKTNFKNRIYFKNEIFIRNKIDIGKTNINILKLRSEINLYNKYNQILSKYILSLLTKFFYKFEDIENLEKLCYSNKLDLKEGSLSYLKKNIKFLKERNNYEYDFFINDKPEFLRLIFCVRKDLYDLNLHISSNEQELCQWLLLHGLNEYPNIKKEFSKSIFYWLTSKGKGSTYSRIIISLKNLSKDKKIFFKYQNIKSLSKKWLKQNWENISLPLPINFYKSTLTGNFQQFFVFLLNNYWKSNKLFLCSNSSKRGVNLIGHLRHNLGIGEDARTTYNALKEMDIPINLIEYNPIHLNERLDHKISFNFSNKEIYNTTIICLSAEQTINFILEFGKRFFNNSYTIAYFPWELPNWPKKWLQVFNYVDEFWASTEFIKKSLTKSTYKPVKVLPLSVSQKLSYVKNIQTYTKKLSKNYWRQKYKISKNDFVFIIFCDSLSSFNRKNLIEGILSFQGAFPNFYEMNNKAAQNTHLIIKIMNSYEEDPNWKFIKSIIDFDSRIKIINAILDKDNLRNLLSSVDALISLHRSEGFGRTIVESLQLGKKVIATNWSGVAEQCECELFYPVDYKLIKLAPYDYVSWANQYWAQPIYESAVKKLLKARFDKPLTKELKDNIIYKFNNDFSSISCGKRYSERLKILGLI